MATEGNPNPYEGGTGGKFRKRPLRKTQTTPYDRPPIALRNPNRSNTGWLSKLVDPAHRFITHGAQSFFSSLLPGEVKENVYSGNRSEEFSASAGGRSSPSLENGSQRIFTRSGAPYIAKDDGSVSLSEGKLSKKGVVGHSTHEIMDTQSVQQFLEKLRGSFLLH